MQPAQVESSFALQNGCSKSMKRRLRGQRSSRNISILNSCLVISMQFCLVLQSSQLHDNLGPSIKYVMLFLANFEPPPPVTLCHTSRDPLESTSHISDPPIFSRPSPKIPDKSPLYKFYLNCSRRFLSRGGFVRVGFCPFPLLSQYICYNRKLNITLNFMFHLY